MIFLQSQDFIVGTFALEELLWVFYLLRFFKQAFLNISRKLVLESSNGLMLFLMMQRCLWLLPFKGCMDLLLFFDFLTFLFLVTTLFRKTSFLSFSCFFIFCCDLFIFSFCWLTLFRRGRKQFGIFYLQFRLILKNFCYFSICK